MGTLNSNKKSLPTSLEIKSGDTIYRVSNIYANKGDFRSLWEDLIVKAAQSNGQKSECKNCKRIAS